MGGNTTGNITYKRYVQDVNWHLLAAPVTSQSIPAFVEVAGNAVTQSGSNYAVSYYKNTNSAGKYWMYHSANPTEENQETLTSFIAGRGYRMKRAAAGEYTFTGTMANTDVSVTIPTTSTNGTASAYFRSAIANPFPSFLSVSDILTSDNLIALGDAFAFLYFGM